MADEIAEGCALASDKRDLRPIDVIESEDVTHGRAAYAARRENTGL